MTVQRIDNVLSWASDLEDEALRQALRTSRLPFLAGPLALMPDAHFGMGATVGSVIATKGAIIPAAVGVDVGCLDRDTEFLSPSGWVKISEYTGQDVLGYDVDSDTAAFVQPTAYIVKDYDSFYHLKGQKGLDQMVTHDHKMLFFTGAKGRGFKPRTFMADDFISRHLRLNKGIQGGFKAAFSFSSDGLDLTLDQIRLQIMISADGRLRKLKSVPDKVEMHFKKQRKIDRCKMLLEDAGIPYLESGPGKDGSVFISFTPPRWSKDLSFLYQASTEQLKAVCEEVLFWDGSSFTLDGTTRTSYVSTDKSNADAVQFAFTATGIRAGIYKQTYQQESWKPCYYVIPTNNVMVGMSLLTPPTTVPSVDGKAYCFTMPTGFFVMRRGNNIVVTGNCGMIAVETNLVDNDLPDSLDFLLSNISREVPSGVGKGHAPSMKKRPEPNSMPKGLDSTSSRIALEQYGSLGSGNHFIEICVDERKVIWVVLHSGSRGIGNRLASKHIAGAKKLMQRMFISLEDPDLAYLVEGTPEFKSYIDDMIWAQDYARGNREVMMDAVLRQVFIAIPKGHEIQRVNCHHNFTVREQHLGKTVWLTRKGAIRAREGDLGVIPGSMGTSSYIVSGRGNPASYMSCAHGAGRKMSRGKARASFDISSLRKAMKGRTWGGMEGRAWSDQDAKALLDEHPDAYKDIDTVMNDQKDLVRIEHTLTQILNYKGC